jgi:hypothetical protein
LRISPSGANLIRTAPVFSSRPRKKSAGEGGAKQGCNSMTRLLIERIVAVPCGAGASAALHSIPFACWLNNKLKNASSDGWTTAPRLLKNCEGKLNSSFEFVSLALRVLPRRRSRTDSDTRTQAESHLPARFSCASGPPSGVQIMIAIAANRLGKRACSTGAPPSTRYTAVYYGNQAQTGIDCGCSHPS